MDYEIKLCNTSPENIKQYNDLLNFVFPGNEKYSIEYLNWQYKENPFGEVVGYDAWYDGKIIAHYPSLPVSYFVDGVETLGLISLNVATHPDHQGKGLFAKLAGQSYIYSREQGFKFVIGLGNQNSTHTYITKYDFKNFGPIEVKIGMGKIIDKPNMNNVRFRSNLSDAFLDWRLANPNAKYFNQGGVLVAATEKPFVSCQLSASNILTNRKFPSKFFGAKVFMGPLNNKIVKGFFMELPKKLRRSPLNFIFKNLTDTPINFNMDDVSFEPIDFDAY